MAREQRPSGQVRDEILKFFQQDESREASVEEIYTFVSDRIGVVARSSIRSYLQLSLKFERVRRGVFRMRPQKDRADRGALDRRLLMADTSPKRDPI